jgi:diguanylate cyclase (GGDEF)-like protein
MDEPTSSPANETEVSQPKSVLQCGSQACCLINIHPPGPYLGRRYPLGTRPVLFGRDDNCDIHITDSSVSRRHAQIEPTLQGFMIQDLQSTNGTLANDELIHAPRLLRDGDYLQVGNFIFRFLSGGNVESNYHEEIYRLTVLDGLTRTNNRRTLDEFLARELIRSQRHNRQLSVLMFDLDRFKSINDTYGHLCGDFVLRELANLFRPFLREEDLFARYGGEEFALILVETHHNDAVEAANRLRETVAGHKFTFEENTLHVTVSVGVVTTCGGTGVTPDDLLRESDRRLYEAKRTGRNRVVGEQTVCLR